MLTVHCPICKRPVVWSEESAHRPFCSQACKDSDLGAWATESYRISSNDADTEDDSVSTTPQPNEHN